MTVVGHRASWGPTTPAGPVREPARTAVSTKHRSESTGGRMDAATIVSLPQPSSVDVASRDGLSERDEQVLAFERQWWKYAGAKESAIRELFDMSATRYYQVLNALIDDPAALAHDPMLIKRLRRMRSSRQRARSARRLGDA